MTVYYASTFLAVVLGWGAQSLRGRTTEAEPPGSTSASRQARWAAFGAFGVLATVGVLRWRVGTDYGTYIALFGAYAAEPWREWTLTSEPGLRLFAKLAVWSGGDYVVMFGIAAVITTGLAVMTLYRYSPAFALSLLLYVITGPWLASFNGVRQYVAVAVVFAGHRYIVERSFFKYALVVLVAGLFHVSAFLLILFYFVPRRRLSMVTAAVAMAAAWLATAVYDRILEVVVIFREDAEFGGADSYFTEDVSLLRIAVALAPLLFYALVTDKSALGSKDHFYVHMALLNAAIMLASIGSAYVARFSAYTGVFLCLAIPSLLPTRNPRLRALSLIVMLPLYFAFWYIDTSVSPSLTNFRWIFERGAGP